MEGAGRRADNFLTIRPVVWDTTMRRAAAGSDAMTQIGMEDGSTEKTQRIYARLAGFLFLWLIITGLAGVLTISRIAGSGTFAETAKRVVASEHLYRAALSSALIETLSAVLLAFALYVTLKPVDKLLAQVAMYCRLGEAFIGGAGMIFDFVKLRLYTSPQSLKALGADQSQALVDLTRAAGFASYNISALFFSIGSILFCYLFFKSRYIPRILSAFGVVASVIVTIICFGSLIFPEYSGTLQYGWAPMAIAEVATGIWLMVFAVKTRARSDQQSARPAIIRS
jgi:Domain of unknown function (DUF4386)